MSFKNIYYDSKNNKIYLWEIGEDGSTVRIEEEFQHKYYIKDKSGQSIHKDIFGQPVIERITTKSKEMIDLKNTGIDTYETEVRPETKFLLERYAGKELKVDLENFNIGYLDIEVESGTAKEPDDWKPEKCNCVINLITMKSSKTGITTTFGNQEYKNMKDTKFVGDYYYCKDEETLFNAFISWFRKQKFDIITGWNSSFYDIPYIINRGRKIVGDKELLKLSPINKVDLNRHKIHGITHLDYLEIYKNFTYVTLPSYSLDNVGMHEVKEGKLDLEGQIHTIYETDWEKFVDYNIQDVWLVEKIDKKRQLIKVALTFAYETLTPTERISSSVAVSTGAILKKLREFGMVMPDRKHQDDWWVKEKYYIAPDGTKQNWIEGEGVTENHSKGGHVEAKPGFYKHNLSYDITSEYPHMIMQYNISPETKVIKPTQEMIDSGNLIKSQINGVYYRKDIDGVLPQIVRYFFAQRKAYKKKMFECSTIGDKSGEQYFDSLQMIYKILINSMYGVLLNEYFPFHDVDNARAITRGGRVLIRHLAQVTNDYFHGCWHKIAKKYFPDTTFGDNPDDRITGDLICVIDTDSVTGDTLVRTDKGELTIESIYDEYAKNIKETYENNFISEVDGLKALSFNTKSEDIEMNKVTYIKKHKVTKRMFEIEFEGKNVIVTEDHSVIIKRNGEYLDLSPKEIKETDELIKIKGSEMIKGELKKRFKSKIC